MGDAPWSAGRTVGAAGVQTELVDARPDLTDVQRGLADVQMLAIETANGLI